MSRAARPAKTGSQGLAPEAPEGRGRRHANSVMVQPGETKHPIGHFAQVDNARFGCHVPGDNVPGHFQAGLHGLSVAAE